MKKSKYSRQFVLLKWLLIVLSQTSGVPDMFGQDIYRHFIENAPCPRSITPDVDLSGVSKILETSYYVSRVSEFVIESVTTNEYEFDSIGRAVRFSYGEEIVYRFSYNVDSKHSSLKYGGVGYDTLELWEQDTLSSVEYNYIMSDSILEDSDKPINNDSINLKSEQLKTYLMFDGPFSYGRYDGAVMYFDESCKPMLVHLYNPFGRLVRIIVYQYYY